MAEHSPNITNNYRLGDYLYPKYRNYQNPQEAVDDYINMLKDYGHPYHYDFKSSIPLTEPPSIRDYLNALDQKDLYNQLTVDQIFDAAWEKSNMKVTNSFRSISTPLIGRGIAFGRSEDEHSIWDQDDVLTTCQDIVKRNGNFYGCTEQDGIPEDDLGVDIVYERPPSRTFISNAWDKRYVELVVDHELEHQAIISTGQMLYKAFHDFNKLRPGVVDSVLYGSLIQELYSLDANLDLSDRPVVDKLTNKIYLDKRSDVYPKLKIIMNKFVRGVESRLNQ